MAAALVVVVCSGPSRLAGQSAQADYKSIVEDYRRGQRSSLDKVGAADERTITEWIELARPAGTGAWDWETLRAAAIMHTEAWTDALHEQRPDAARIHLDASIRLFQRVRDTTPGQVDFIARWRIVVSGLLRRVVNPGLADDFDARTSPMFLTDAPRQAATRWFLIGLEAEREAGEQKLAGVSIASVNYEERQRAWGRALTSYDEALKRDPDYALAILHRGRVGMLFRSWAAAAEDFTRVRDADDPRIRYLALLFLGSLAEREGRYEEAERAYRDAMKTYPTGQAWSLALSQLLSRTGREAEARNVIELLGSHSSNLVEPLWTYIPPRALELVDLQMSFNELRAEVVK